MLESLPDECAIIVLAHTDATARQLGILSLVSQRLHQLSSDDALWRRVFVHFAGTRLAECVKAHTATWPGWKEWVRRLATTKVDVTSIRARCHGDSNFDPNIARRAISSACTVTSLAAVHTASLLAHHLVGRVGPHLDRMHVWIADIEQTVRVQSGIYGEKKTVALHREVVPRCLLFAPQTENMLLHDRSGSWWETLWVRQALMDSQKGRNAPLITLCVTVIVLWYAKGVITAPMPGIVIPECFLEANRLPIDPPAARVGWYNQSASDLAKRVLEHMPACHCDI